MVVLIVTILYLYLTIGGFVAGLFNDGENDGTPILIIFWPIILIGVGALTFLKVMYNLGNDFASRIKEENDR